VVRGDHVQRPPLGARVGEHDRERPLVVHPTARGPRCRRRRTSSSSAGGRCASGTACGQREARFAFALETRATTKEQVSPPCRDTHLLIGPVARPGASSVVGPARPIGRSPGFPRKEEPVLAGFELTPTTPLDEHRASRRRCQDWRSAPRMRQRRPGGPFLRCRAGLDVERDGGSEAVLPRTPAAERSSAPGHLISAARTRRGRGPSHFDPSTSNASAGHRCRRRGTPARGQSLLTAAPLARSGLRCSRNRSSRGCGSSVSIITAVPGQAFCR
jgi:hypothetical protein